MNRSLRHRRRISASLTTSASVVGRSRIGVLLRGLPVVIAITAGCTMGTRGESIDVSDDARDAGGVSSEAGSQKPESLRASCGNGVREVGEDCDLGAQASASTYCSQRCRTRDLLAPTIAVPDGGAFARTLGAGRHPIAAGAAGFAIAIVESVPSPRLVLRTFDTNGLAAGAPVVLDAACASDANPSVAALSGNRYVVVWTDTAIDERDVAMRIVDATASTVGPLAHANARATGSQYDADVVSFGGQIVVAWTDTQAVATAPDISYRIFDATTLAATAIDDVALAATSAVEGAVALAPFGSGWAAAWRDEQSDGERLQVQAGSTRWTIGPFVAGASGDRAALLALDSNHLFVAYSESTDPADSGVVNAAKLRGAVLDVGAPGSIAPFWVSPVALAQDQPSAVLVGATPFLSWRTAAATGDANAEELWLKPLAWNGAALDTSAAEMTLPRWPQQHRPGDQRVPALAASAIAGGALVMAWVDLGKTFGGSEGQGDVAFELAPVPIVRGAGTPDDSPCPSGQRYCDSVCTSTQSDSNNCGGCGAGCDGISNGTPTCIAGACGSVCNSGFHSCGSGCASNASVATCGSSCTPCGATPNATATCDGTTCGFACNGGFHACGGACAPSTAVATCGASCTPCATPPNGTATCDGTSCGVACNSGFHNCGGACASSASIATCGASCTSCVPPANGSATCDGTSCGFACNTGFHACGGACTSNASVATCGSSCTPCAPPANASATCNGGSCGFACNAGFHTCGGACAPSTSPLSCGASCTPCTAPANATATCDGTSCGFTCNAGTVWDGAQCTDPSAAVFASAAANGNGNGTAAAPYNSLQKAINLAAATNRRVLACADADFQEAIILANNVTVLGAFHCASNNWQFAAGLRARVVAPTSPAVRAVNVTAVIDSLDITAPDAPAGAQPAASSIGLFVSGSPALSVVRSIIRSGRGGDGADGTLATLTNAGTINGSLGVGGTSQCMRDGVAYGTSYAGGAGGDAGTREKICGESRCMPGKVCPCIWDIQPPGPGAPGGGPLGGAGGQPGGGAAMSGGSGTNGTNGASAAFVMGGFVQGGSYFVAAADGAVGGDAAPGSGGGGSPGTAATTAHVGASGTGGGAGGCGGLGGGSGRAGGASIAVLVFGSTIVFTSTTIQAGAGGNGGKGSFGGAGTTGGVGGSVGGNGGSGGAAGNGAGGPSIGLAYTGIQPALGGAGLNAGAGGSGVAARTVGGTTIAASGSGGSWVLYAF